MTIEFLHTMIRVSDIDATLRFFVDGLGLQEVSRVDNEAGRFTLVFLASPDDIERTGFDTSGSPLRSGLPMVELTYNWDPEELCADLHLSINLWYPLCQNAKQKGS